MGLLLTFVACLSFGPAEHAAVLVVWLTVSFFVLELDILMQVRKTGETRGLFWLPLIFALWANLHIQFVYGLIVLLIALVEAVAAQKWIYIRTRSRFSWLFADLHRLCIGGAR